MSRNERNGKKIVLKLGGSIITKKTTKDFPLEIGEIKERADDYIRCGVIRRLGKEIREAIDGERLGVIIVNGAGPFGHNLVKYKRPEEDVRKSVRYLNEKLVSEFRKNGLKIVSVSPSKSCGFVDENFDISKLWGLARVFIEEGKIFSTHGDMLGNGKIISGDDLIVLLAKQWQADKIITVTDVDGVFTKDPKIYDDVEFIEVLGPEKDVKVEYTINNIDVTGGMASKVKKLRHAAAHGINCRIINGLKEGNVKAALLGGDKIGTLILP